MKDPDHQSWKTRNASAIKRYRRKRLLSGYDFYRTELGHRAPVEKFWHSLRSSRDRDEFRTEMDMLGSLGPEAGSENSKHVRGKIFEWRFDINSCTYRVFYAVDEERHIAILLHAIIKDEVKLLQKDIDIAVKRWNDYLERRQSQTQNRHLSF